MKEIQLLVLQNFPTFLSFVFSSQGLSLLLYHDFMTGKCLSCIHLQSLVFWNSIHQEVASDSFCFLCNCSWLLVFILYVFFMIFLGFNLYCWKGIHFSQNNFLIFVLLFLGLIFSFHFIPLQLLFCCLLAVFRGLIGSGSIPKTYEMCLDRTGIISPHLQCYSFW